MKQSKWCQRWLLLAKPLLNNTVKCLGKAVHRPTLSELSPIRFHSFIQECDALDRNHKLCIYWIVYNVSCSAHPLILCPIRQFLNTDHWLHTMTFSFRLRRRQSVVHITLSERRKYTQWAEEHV